MRQRAVVCVGFADWDAELWTNQQHLMSRLAARGSTVLFVESLGLRRPQIAGRDLRRMARRLVRGLAPPRERDGVHVLSPLVVPLHSNAVVSRLNALLLRRRVGRAARRLGMRRPVLWGYVPQAEALIGALDPEQVVYHCVDDIAEQKGVDGEAFRAAEGRFVARADLVLASAPALAERLGPAARRLLYAPNVADTARFAAALGPGPVDPAVEALPRPRVVFTGAVVATKLDVGLIAELARARPELQLVFVGPVGVGDPGTDVSGLRDLPNVHLLGPRTYDELPSVLRGADAGLIPYAINELTRSVFPMKVYEYLAAGLPVVATPLPAIREVEGVEVAGGAQGVAAALDGVLAEDDPERRRARSAAARAFSWERRLEEIDAALAG